LPPATAQHINGACACGLTTPAYATSAGVFEPAAKEIEEIDVISVGAPRRVDRTVIVMPHHHHRDGERSFSLPSYFSASLQAFASWARF
jgi:hypothetical protein